MLGWLSTPRCGLNSRGPNVPAHKCSIPSAFRRDPAYTRYAEVYDAIGQRIFGERIAEATLAFFEERSIRPSRMIDLACGSGAASLIFAAAGIQVKGVDRSQEMLAAARKSAAEADIPIAFQCADMRDFEVDQPVDLVTCFYDGLNYVTQLDEVAEVFASVRAALEPGGLFVFDLNTLRKFETNWNDSCYLAVDRDDMFGVYRSWFNAESGISPLILTFFVLTADGVWERFEEEHIERAYPLEQINRQLAAAGFDLIELLDYADRSKQFGGPGSENSHRVVYIAKRSPDVAKSRS
jgi:SAM-dependent methyltransferase